MTSSGKQMGVNQKSAISDSWRYQVNKWEPIRSQPSKSADLIGPDLFTELVAKGIRCYVVQRDQHQLIWLVLICLLNSLPWEFVGKQMGTNEMRLYWWWHHEINKCGYKSVWTVFHLGSARHQGFLSLLVSCELTFRYTSAWVNPASLATLLLASVANKYTWVTRDMRCSAWLVKKLYYPPIRN